MPTTTVPAAATGLPTPALRAGNSRAMRATRNEAKFRAWVDPPPAELRPSLAALIEREQTRSRIEAALAALIAGAEAEFVCIDIVTHGTTEASNA